MQARQWLYFKHHTKHNISPGKKKKKKLKCSLSATTGMIHITFDGTEYKSLEIIVLLPHPMKVFVQQLREYPNLVAH